MSNILNITISESKDALTNPQSTAYICLGIDMDNKEEYNCFFCLTNFFCKKGFYVYASYPDGDTLDITTAYKVMKEFEKRHPDDK